MRHLTPLSITLACCLLTSCLRDRDGDGVFAIAVIGDSKSAQYSNVVSWPTQLARQLSTVCALPQTGASCVNMPVRIDNFATAFATAIHPSIPWFTEQWSGQQQLNAEELGYDLVIADFGTNDIGSTLATPSQAINELLLRKEAAGQRPMLVLTQTIFDNTAYPQHTPALFALNGMITDVFSTNAINSTVGLMDSTWSDDGTHPNTNAQTVRMQRVLTKIRAMERQ